MFDSVRFGQRARKLALDGFQAILFRATHECLTPHGREDSIRDRDRKIRRHDEQDSQDYSRNQAQPVRFQPVNHPALPRILSILFIQSSATAAA
jgi:hypothetical protein